MKKVLKSVSTCFVILAMLTTAALAAVPSDPVEPQASKYISQTTTGVVAKSGGKLEFAFDIAATGRMKDVGALEVYIYEVGVSDPVWYHYYKDSGCGYMMDHNTSSHTFTVNYTGTPGHKYYANVTFYAGEHGVAGDLYIMDTVVVTAKK